MSLTMVLSVCAVVISFTSLCISTYFASWDRARIKARSTFFPSRNRDEDELPAEHPILQIEIANHGRRPVKLESMLVKYADGSSAFCAETLWDTDKHGQYRIGENGVYRHTIDPDHDSFLNSEAGSKAVDIFFEDTLEHFPFLCSAPQALARAVSRCSMCREGRWTRHTKTGNALGRKYVVRGLRDNLAAYVQAASEYPY